RLHEGKDLVLPTRADGGRAHVVEVPVVPVEPQQQGGYACAALLPAQADDDAVRGLVLLDLDHAVARAREIGQPEPLRDDTVEARRLERVQPLLRLVSVPGDGGEVEAVELLEPGPP